MLLDEVLRRTLGNFSTLFLCIFAVVGPLHLIYAFAFQDVLALRELHDAIAQFPPSRQVRGVGQEALSQARVWLWVLTVVELLLLPLFVRVAAHVLAMDQRDEVPTVSGAWRRVRASADRLPRAAGNVAPMVAGAVLFGIAVGFLTEATLMLVADLVPDEAAFGVIALARAAGHSAGGAFVVAALVSATGKERVTEEERVMEEAPELY